MTDDRADDRQASRTGSDRPRRAARGRDGCLGRRALGRRAAGRLGRRRHQGRAAQRRPDAQRLRLARHRQGLPQPRLRAGQPGQAQRRPRPAPARGAGTVGGAAVDGGRLPDQPASRRARRPRPRTGGHRRPPLPPRLLQRQRVRPARRGPQPAGLRHRGLLGPLGPLGAAGQQRGRPAQRARRHRRPHQRAGRPGRPPGRGARATPDRAWPRRRGLAAADRDVRPRVGPQPAGDRRQGGQGRGAALQPDAVDELLPDQGRPLVLLHGSRGGPPHRPRAARPRPDRPAGRPPLRERQGAAQEPHRGHRHPRRHRRGAHARRVGRAARRRGRLVGAGPGPGRRARRPAARRQRRVPPAPRRHRRHETTIHQRPGELLRPARRPGGAGAVSRRAHRRGAGRARGAPGRGPRTRLRPDRGPGPAGPGR